MAGRKRGNRKTFNASVDADVLDKSTERLRLLGMDRSGFIESQLVLLLRATDAAAPYLEKMKGGELSEGEIKVLLRQHLAGVQGVMAGFHGDMADMMKYAADLPSTQEKE